MFQQITIIGSGLLGASLGMAVSKNGLAQNIKVWARREETLSHCNAQDWCTYTESDLERSVKGSEFVIICTPVGSIPEILKRIISVSDEGTIITDVGSVKSEICYVGDDCTTNAKAEFIGSHPMAGSENSGMKYADINLFEEKPCIVTPTKKSSRNTVDKTMKFWSELNMYVYELLPEEHDDAVSYFSHLPHLISSCLAHNLEKKPETWRKISGNGIRDTTRIAAGDPDLWRQIFMMNKEKLLSALEDWEQSLMNFKDIIKNDDNEKILSFLKKGAKFRKGL